MKFRPASPTRKAFEAAASGAHVPISLEAIGQVNEVSGPKKLGRMLSPDGDLNPSWGVLEEIMAHDAETVLRELSAAYGFQPPVRKPRDIGVVLDEVLDVLRGNQDVVERAGELLEQLAEIRASEPAVRVMGQRRQAG